MKKTLLEKGIEIMIVILGLALAIILLLNCTSTIIVVKRSEDVQVNSSTDSISVGDDFGFDIGSKNQKKDSL